MGELSLKEGIMLIIFILFLVLLSVFIIYVGKEFIDAKCVNAFGNEFHLLQEVTDTTKRTHTVYCGNGKEVKTY